MAVGGAEGESMSVVPIPVSISVGACWVGPEALSGVVPGGVSGATGVGRCWASMVTGGAIVGTPYN